MAEINCRKCKNIFVTWDKNFPYGCKAFGIKTKLLPSIEILNSSGKECQNFSRKEEAGKK